MKTALYSPDICSRQRPIDRATLAHLIRSFRASGGKVFRITVGDGTRCRQMGQAFYQINP